MNNKSNNTKTTQQNERIVFQQITLVVTGFLLTFLILGFAANIVLSNLEENYQKLDYLVNQNNAKAAGITKLSDAIRDRMLIVYEMLHTDDYFELDELNMLFSSKATEFLKSREELMALDLTEIQIQELVDQREILKKAQIAFSEVVANALNEKGVDSSKLVRHARDVNAGVLNRLKIMMDNQASLARQDLLEANRSYEETRHKMYVLGAAGLIMSLFIVYYIIRQIRTQGQVLTHVMGQLEDSNTTLEKRVEKRTSELLQTREENTRMSTELEIGQELQTVILPREEELSEIEGLDIAGYMEAADEIGGDYYEVLQHDNGAIIGIGDVTGHGLESGIVMLMTQSIVRSQTYQENQSISSILKLANKTIHDNVSRMQSDKILTLLLLDYKRNNGNTATITYSGQHETILIVRSNGELEEIDTDEAGFPIGLVTEADDYFKEETVGLQKGDTVVLYTDGITEAENSEKQLYGIERFRDVLSSHYEKSANDLKDCIIEDVKAYIGDHKVHDDITLVVLKQQ